MSLYKSSIETGRLHYRIPSERAIDNAIYRGNYRAAEQYAQEIIDQRNDATDAFNTEAFHARIKQIALPLHKWLEVGAGYEVPDFDAERDISAVYGEYVELLETLLTEHQQHPLDYEEQGWRRGAITEVTFFALLSRSIRGEASDPFVTLPSTRRDDVGSINSDGQLTGIDASLVNRFNTEEAIALQLTTSGKQDTYRPDILVLSLREIAGDNMLLTKILQESLIKEVNGQASGREETHIANAEHRMYERIRQHHASLYDSVA